MSELLSTLIARTVRDRLAELEVDHNNRNAAPSPFADPSPDGAQRMIARINATLDERARSAQPATSAGVSFADGYAIVEGVVRQALSTIQDSLAPQGGLQPARAAQAQSPNQALAAAWGAGPPPPLVDAIVQRRRATEIKLGFGTRAPADLQRVRVQIAGTALTLEAGDIDHFAERGESRLYLEPPVDLSDLGHVDIGYGEDGTLELRFERDG